MPAPNPEIKPGNAIKLVDAKVLFSGRRPVRNSAASIVHLGGSSLLLAYMHKSGDFDQDNGVVLLRRSEDRGVTWSQPKLLYEYPGWSCLLMGGINVYSDGFIRTIIGRIQVDRSLGGDEPMKGWWVSSIDSYDNGWTWSVPAAEIRLFPYWTEMYGASNPHHLSDGNYMLAVMGTNGRDTGWHSAVIFTDPMAKTYFNKVVIAQQDGLNFSDTDIVLLSDGRYLAVIREHTTRNTYYSHSDDEGKTWTVPTPTGLKGANNKLIRLNSGAILYAYRDEDPSRWGVSCSISDDGGKHWEHLGQLYKADKQHTTSPGSLCGYPDMVYSSNGNITCILHTYVGKNGEVDLHLINLKDLT